MKTCIHHGTADPNKPRLARCSCGSERPSADRTKLAFFEDKSDVSKTCVNCHYGYSAHDPVQMARTVNRRTVVETGRCPGFEPHAPWAYDTYYCGCRGWD